jgi:hypothetical protein
MLDLQQIVADIHLMGSETRRRNVKSEDTLVVARRTAGVDPAAWPAVREALDSLPADLVPWLAATPPVDPPATVVACPGPVPPVYTAVATDGSQIPFDRHFIAPCYLLNVGTVVLHYGTGERASLSATAHLAYRDDEIYTGEEQAPLSERMLATRRFRAEAAALATLIAENQGRENACAFVDAPLIVWTQQGEREPAQKEMVSDFCEMLSGAQKTQTPVVGYISRPGGRDVVGLLRRMRCGPDCPHRKSDPCSDLAGLTDARLFDSLLARPGERSTVFRSAAPGLADYPDDLKICFFYVNVGAEVARVEVPAWVADSPALLDRVHVLVLDQVAKAEGYPVCLIEAHERAIVRSQERAAFYRLVEQIFINDGVPVRSTRKALAKRSPVL